MKRRWLYLFLLSFWLCAVLGFKMPPAPTGGVSDFAGVLNQDQITAIDARLKSFYENSGKQALVAILPTIEDNSIEDVAATMFKTWGIGDKKRNDGILLLLAIQERKLRIEVGYGSEGELPDQLAGRIIQDDLRPLLRSGQYAQAILIFEARLQEIFLKDGGEAYRKIAPPLKPSNLWNLFFLILMILFLIRLIDRRGSGRSLTSHGGFFVGGLGGLGRGGGSDWFGGGGGMSGGGGASGDW